MKIYDSHIINYEVPFNFTDADRELFYDENFSYVIPSVEILELNHAFVSKDTVFAGGIVHDKLVRRSKLGFWNKLKRIIKIFSNKIVVRRSNILGFQIWSNNYFHWMTETLPSIWSMHKLYPGISVLIPRTLSELPFIQQSLKYLSIKFECFEDDKSVLVGNLLCICTPHVGRFNHLFITSFSKEFKKYILKNVNPTSFRKLFISRGKASRRRILNEEKLCESLEKIGFDILFLEDLTLENQVKYFNEASIVVSSHGAGLSNIMFMSPGTKVFELKSSDNDYWCFFSLSRTFDLKYGYMLCESDGRNHRDADITVNIEKLNHILIEFISLN